ncbi:MAG: glutamine--tRNA ligase/YqeY domain fusion protein [Phycisphaerales bacterium]|nr:glutamine--tRNA ligase/YqeY domain fusion protein [Phycisphaerales bacterium]
MAQPNNPIEGRDTGAATPRDFIREIIDEHNRTGRFGGRVATRFPPEPNGYLHIGHAKSICLNYGLAAEYGGTFNLRMDDTNPSKEDQEYVDSIIDDVRWLGARWPGMRDDDKYAGVLWASNYFDQMYAWAVELIRKGKAYVCDLSADEMSRSRGTLTRPGQPSPHRDRSIAENLDLFERMRRGEFPNGAKTLRARIDMAHPNLNMRDPVMYRIVHESHHNTGDAWCIYPMYDWAHGFEDSIEGITHSICTLEFEIHRPLYDWFIDAVNEGRTDDGSGPWGRRIHHPQQIEFARLNLTYTVMSKRRLLELVKGGHVRGWDDPRMPTISGMRRRGYPAEAIREFCRRIGVSKTDSVIDLALLEHCVRDELNRTAPRVMAVLRPLRVVIENYPDDQVEEFELVNNPENPAAGTRKVPFSKVLYIEQDDFRAEPPPKYFRLAPGREVRLRGGYFIKCVDFKTGADGQPVELRCTYDPATRSGDAPDGRKVKATIHWVSAAHALPIEARLYETLFTKPDPDDVSDDAIRAAEATGLAGAAATVAAPATDWKSNLNPRSEEVVLAYVEPSVAGVRVGARYQFERLGYFCVDPDTEQARRHEGTEARRGEEQRGEGAEERRGQGTEGRRAEGAEGRRSGEADAPAASTPAMPRLVFNRTVTLKDEWAKIEKRGSDRR